MATTQSIIRYNDDRTGKKYAVQVTPECPPKYALERLVGMAERDYQASLPPDKRAVANQPADFKCPHCKTHTQPTVRKQAMVSGGFFFFIGSISTTLKDIWACVDCKSEFLSEELLAVRRAVERSNSALQFERFRDGEITDEVRISATRASHNV